MHWGENEEFKLDEQKMNMMVKLVVYQTNNTFMKANIET